VARKLATYAGAVAFACLAVTAISRIPAFAVVQFNADSLWEASFVWDVLHHPYAWAGFQLSDNLNFFPELALGTIFQLVLHSWRWAVFADAVVRFLALGLLGGWIVATLSELELPDAMLVVEGVLAATFLAGGLALTLPGGRLLYGDLLIAGNHAGGFIIALILTALWLRQPQVNRHVGWAVLAYAVATLAILSDRLLWMDFVLPVGIVSIAIALRTRVRGRRSAALGYASLVVAAGISGLVVGLPFKNHQAALPPLPALADLFPRAHLLWNQSLGFARSTPLALAGELALLALFAAFPVLLSLDPKDRDRDERSWLFWSYGALAIAACTVTTVVLYLGPETLRYVDVALFVLVPVATAVFARWVQGRLALRILTAVIALAAVSDLVEAGTILPGSLTARPYLAECLDVLRERFDLRAGLAEYWTARPLMMDADGMLQVDQIAADGRPFYSTNDLSWYQHSFADPSQLPPYRFVIIRSVDPAAILSRYGKPNQIRVCIGDEPRLPRPRDIFGVGSRLTPVWIYDDPVRVLPGSAAR